MTGIKIRLSRFAENSDGIFDLSLGGPRPANYSALIVFPHQLPELLAEESYFKRIALIIRLTGWDGSKMTCLCGAETAAALGGDSCAVDLVAGYEDTLEIESMRLLAHAVKEAHALGLPVVAMIRLNKACSDYSACLEVPLAAAEEIGADAVILPTEATAGFSPTYQSTVPLFIAGADGVAGRLKI